jgi:hypothetical protein
MLTKGGCRQAWNDLKGATSYLSISFRVMNGIFISYFCTWFSFSPKQSVKRTSAVVLPQDPDDWNAMSASLVNGYLAPGQTIERAIDSKRSIR